jgi:hypothetical protein
MITEDFAGRVLPFDSAAAKAYAAIAANRRAAGLTWGADCQIAHRPCPRSRGGDPELSNPNQLDELLQSNDFN